MLRWPSAARVFGSLAAVVFVCALPAVAAATDCSLLEVSTPDKAKHRVFLTRFLTEDKTAGRYKNCRIVKTAESGTETFLITPFRQDATLVVHPSNWPR